MIDVIDYRAGNAPSVGYALERLGVPCRLTGDPAAVRRSGRLVLPGVGAARATLDSLRDSGLLEPIADRVRGGVPFLGICVGLQVLFEHSEEDDAPCLGWLPGRVRRFPDSQRVPQIGWNVVRPARRHPLLDGAPPDGHCYFVNSYYAEPADASDVVATTDYGIEFASVVGRDNVVATQFHTEKSGELGLRLLDNFTRWEP
jgi:imidazole glycerol-phosphate synthase subunit HisH